MRQIAIYGKGGIGKSTTSSNLSAALAAAGHRVMQVGCDPKQDSTMNLMGGRLIPSVLDIIRRKGERGVELRDCCFEGYGGVIVAEAGGPEPGIGCAGRGVISALQTLERLGAYKHYGIDVVIYDVLGDVVCGGFAMPIREGFAREIYIVTSGEMMALYAANNICRAVRRFIDNGVPIRLGGLICNARNTYQEVDTVGAFAQELSCRVVRVVPRSRDVQIAESRGMTVIEALPHGEQAKAYRDLASVIIDKPQVYVPSPITTDRLQSILASLAGSSELATAAVA